MLHTINITVHVIAGTIAMFVALVPYASKKGGSKHRKYGRIFLWLMGIVILTALNGVFFFRDRPFLTVVTLLSFYAAYSGFRILKTRETGFQLIDVAVMIAVILAGISFVIQIQTANVFWHVSIVYYLLGYVFVLVGFDLVRYFFPNLIRYKRFWIYEHIYKMTGAFTALVSAGVGTVLAGWEPYNQIVPASLSTLWLVFCLIYFPKQVR